MELNDKPCYRCQSTNKVLQRDKLSFHIILWGGLFVFGLAWIILPFLPKKVYCASCGALVGA